MNFDLDKQINKNYQEILMNFLGVNSLQNYNITVEELLEKNYKIFFDTYFKLTYKLTTLENRLLLITAHSQSFNNHNFSISNQNNLKPLFTYNDIDFATINQLDISKPTTESKKYLLNIISRTDTKNVFKIFIELEKTIEEVLATRFVKNYLIKYKLKKDIKGWYKQFKYHLLSSYKNEITLPQRDDIAYKYIESFSRFELTYKIFYEMAIRNSRAKKIIHALDYLHDIKNIQKKPSLMVDEISCEKMENESVYKIFGTVSGNEICEKSKLFIILNNSKCQCITSIVNNTYEITIFQHDSDDKFDLVITLEEDIHQNYKDNLGIPLANSIISIRKSITGVKKNKITQITIIKDDIKFTLAEEDDGSWIYNFDDSTEILDENSFLKKYNDFLMPEEHKIYLSLELYRINELIDEFETKLKDKCHIYYKNSNLKHSEKNKIHMKKALHNSLDIHRLQTDPTYTHSNKYFAREAGHDGYSIYQGILKDNDNEFDISIIKQDATKLVVDKNLTTVELNLNLPIADLKAYITKIKENYDNDNSLLKTPFELLGESLNSTYEKIKDMDALEWADTFYIYDHFKKNINDNVTNRRHEIKTNLTIYHGSLKNKIAMESTNLDLKKARDIQNRFSLKKSSGKPDYIEVDTIRDRYKIMEALIENRKYKFLIDKKTV